MKVIRKSKWRSENAKRARRKFANMRAAKARKRMEALANPLDPAEELPTTAFDQRQPARSGFRVTVTCLDDGVRSGFVAQRMPWGGLSVSPTIAGRRVATTLLNYLPQPKRTLAAFSR